MEVELIIYGAVMLVAMTLAGVIGFAANVLALPVLSLFLPLKTAVAVLMFIVAVQIVIQAWMYRENIQWREVRHIVIWIIIGMPIGFVALNYLPELVMKAVLGLFVAVTALKGIIDDARGKKTGHFSGAALSQATLVFLRAFDRCLWLWWSADGCLLP